MSASDSTSHDNGLKEPDANTADFLVALDHEAILSMIFGKGRYQIVLLIVCSTSCFMFAVQMQSMIFTDYSTQFTCNLTGHSQIIGVHWLDKISFKKIQQIGCDSRKSCSLGPVDIGADQCWGLAKLTNSSKLEPFTCTSWTYGNGQMQRTAVTDFNLICDRAHLVTTAKCLYLVCISIGFLLACAADLLGRRRTILVFILLDIVTSLAMPFVNSISQFLLIRAGRGISCGQCYVFVNLMNELVPTRWRAIFGNIYWISWSFGYMAIAGLAYWTTDWVRMKQWSCLIIIPYLLYPLLLQESPRWLCVKGQSEQAVKVILRVARLNNIKLSEDNIQRIRDYIYEETSPSKAVDRLPRQENLVTVLKSRILLIRTVIFCFIQSSITVVYNYASMHGEFASTNIFLNVFIMGFVELPTSLFGTLLVDYFGRRTCLVMMLAISACTSIFLGINTGYYPTVQIVIASIAKICITIAFMASDLIILELYPTSCRASGLHLILMLSGIVGAFAPYAVDLEAVNLSIPFGICAAACLISAVIAHFILPESKGCPLPQDVQQAETLIRGKEQQWMVELNQ